MTCCGIGVSSLCCSGDHFFQVSLLHDTSPSARRALSSRLIDCVDVAIPILALLLPKVSAHGLLVYQIPAYLHLHPLDVSPRTKGARPKRLEKRMIVW